MGPSQHAAMAAMGVGADEGLSIRGIAKQSGLTVDGARHAVARLRAQGLADRVTFGWGHQVLTMLSPPREVKRYRRDRWGRRFGHSEWTYTGWTEVKSSPAPPGPLKGQMSYLYFLTSKEPSNE